MNDRLSSLAAQTLRGGAPKLSRRRALQLGAGAGALAALPGGAALAQVSGNQFIFGSASLGSTGYVVIEGISTIVNRHSDLKTSSQSTSGGAENVALIGQNLLDFGQSTSVDLYPASKGEKPYNAPISLQQMFCYTTFNLPPIVMADSDIKTFDDMKGKRIAPGAAGGTTAQSWRLMFTEYGFGDSVRWTYGSWTEVYDQFASGTVDCVPAVLSNLKPSATVQQLTATNKIRAVSFPDELIKKAQAQNPGIMVFTVTPDTWPDLPEPCTATGSSGILAAHPTVSADTGYAITKAVYENLDELHGIAAPLTAITLDLSTKYLIPGIPVNAGAAQYFKEQGVWRDELTIAA